MSQDHYDFGMRAVKQICNAAGKYRKENPSVPEDLIVYTVLKANNGPKMVPSDAKLFNHILDDLFPNLSKR